MCAGLGSRSHQETETDIEAAWGQRSFVAVVVVVMFLMPLSWCGAVVD
jgi:hypothetical protein